MEGYAVGWQPQLLACGDEPGVGLRGVRARDDAQAQVDVGHQLGGDREPAGDQEPRHERAGLGDRVRLLGQRQLFPAAGPLELGAEGPWLPGWWTGQSCGPVLALR